MLSLTIPKILFNAWFWIGVLAIIVTIHYFWGKTPAPPKPSKFFLKHKKTVYKITDIFVILVVLLSWLPILYMSVSMALEPILKPHSIPEPLTESLKFTLAFFSIVAIPISGSSAMLIGFLSIFQSNLIRPKRLFLTIISLLPLIFTILVLLTVPREKPEDAWLTIKLGLGSLAGCWLINGPAIIIGKHFVRVWWSIMRKVRWVSGEYPG